MIPRPSPAPEAEAPRAEEHEAWFRAEVQRTVDAVDSGRMGFIGPDEWKRVLEEKRAALKASTPPRRRRNGPF